MATPAGREGLRLALAIGRDAQPDSLNRFIANPGIPVLVASSTQDIADRLAAVSLAVSAMGDGAARHV
jgi:hypothetical protein